MGYWMPKSEQLHRIEAARGPGGGPETLVPTRPERKFERGRMVGAVGILVVLLACVVFFVANLLRPTGGFADLVAAGSVVTPTSGASLMALGRPVGTVVPLSVASPALQLNCRAVRDFGFGSSRVYVQTLVVAAGWSPARGGMLQLVSPVSGWLPAAWFNCDGDVRGLERVYSEDVTVTPVATVTPVVRNVYSRIEVPVTRVVEVTPVPAAIDGVWFDGSCWHFVPAAVVGIWADGKPVAGGQVLCGVKEFRVVVR